jgi:DeoD family purine-nucleoside phosphorylase
VSEAPVHLRPAAELAERVLLPGDPHRALAVAQSLLDRPRMFNHHRGLWGYTGTAADGEPLTIQSTGMGGPSAAIVAEELISLGARRLVRLGTCGALANSAELGSVVIAETVLPEDGTSRALGATTALTADPRLLAALLAAAPGAAAGPVVSTDLFYDPDPQRWAASGAIAVEMGAAALLAVAARHEAAAACVLVVSRASGRHIEPEDLERAEATMGRVGAAALGATA